MKTIAIKIVIVIIAIAIGVYVVSNIISSRRSKVEEEKANAEKKLKIERNISDMVVQFDAVADWRSSFDEKDILEPIYTIHIQEALLKTNGRPILFYASVDDVLKREKQHIVRFVNWLDIGLTIYFELQCNEDQTKRLLEIPTEFFLDEFAVIAQIEEVRKPEFAVRAYARGSEEAEIEVESSDIFIATGKCLDFLYVGDLLSGK